MADNKYIGARYTIKVYENSLDPSLASWESDVMYEPITLVIYNLDSYVSKTEVPPTVGNPEDNPTYWVKTGYTAAQLSNLQNQIDTINNTDIPGLQSQIDTINNTDIPGLQGQINSINDNLNKHTLGTAVTLTDGQDYVVPSVGYARVVTGNITNANGAIRIDGEIHLNVLSVGNLYNYGSLYVRKGTVIKFENYNNATGYFRPLV